MSLTVLAYHDVYSETRPQCEARVSSIYTLSESAFLRQLDSIRPVASGELVATESLFRGHSSIPQVAFTFDDGAMCAATCIAAALEQHGWRGHFFVTTGWIGRPGFLNRDAIRRLRRNGHIVGSHTVTHPERMSHMRAGDLFGEWIESRVVLENIIGEPVTTASVAGGYYSRYVAEAAAAAGFKILFTSQPSSRVSIVDGCAVVGRYTIQRFTPLEEVVGLAEGRRGPRYRQAVMWSAKGVAKFATGKWFPQIRRHILASRSLT